MPTDFVNSAGKQAHYSVLMFKVGTDGRWKFYRKVSVTTRKRALDAAEGWSRLSSSFKATVSRISVQKIRTYE